MVNIDEEIQLIEIILILIVAFIGSCIHEYIFKDPNQSFTLRNFNLWISTLISTILCFIINPWIINLNQRLILLPPLLFGLTGMDLVKRLTTVKGSSSFLEYVLGFFNITNKRNNEIGLKEEEEKKEEQKSSITANDIASFNSPHDLEQIMSLDNLTKDILDNICDILIDFYVHHDKTKFLKDYYSVKTNISLLKYQLHLYQMIPIATTLKMSEIIKKEMELDTVFHDLENYTSTTSTFN